MKIKIEVPDGPAVAGSDKIASALGKVEAAGVKAGAAASKLGKEVGTSTQAAVQPVNMLTKSVSSLADAIRREQDMLRGIRGDVAQHTRDLQTLDSMMKRGTITANEYAAAVAKSKASNGLPGAAQMPGTGDAAKAAQGIAGLNFKAAAAGAAQGFELLNQKLKITDSTLGSAVGSAIKFGAMGAQVGGPWGAAIGAVVGVTADLISKFTDAEAAAKKYREEQAKLAKEYWDGVKAAEAKARIERELAPQMAELARQAGYQAEAERTLNGVMNSQSDAYRAASDQLRAYEKMLDGVNGALSIALTLRSKWNDPTSGGTQTRDQATEVIGVRGKRDAEIAQGAALLSYGKTLIELEGAENKRNDRLRDLEQIMGDNRVTQGAVNAAFREYNKILKDQEALAKGTTKSWQDLHSATQGWADFAGFAELSGTKIEDSLTRAKTAADELVESFDKAFGYETRSVNVGDGDFFKPIDTMKIDRETIATAGQGQDLAKAFADANAEASKLSETGLAIESAFTNVATSLGSSLVDAANGADVAWQDTLGNLVTGFEKAIMQALILQAIGSSTGGAAGTGTGIMGALFGGATGFDGVMSGGGLQKMPAFATGGDAMVGGAGGTDSRIAMLRVTPGESIHVRTPQQQRQAQGSGAQGASVTNVFQQDHRALLPAIDSKDGHRAIMNVIRQQSGPIKSLLGGR